MGDNDAWYSTCAHSQPCRRLKRPSEAASLVGNREGFPDHPLCTHYYQPQIRMHIRRQVQKSGEKTAKRKEGETRARRGDEERGASTSGPVRSNEQIVKLEKTFNHPTAYPVSRYSLYLCSAESTAAVPPGRSAGFRGSPESRLNKIIARILAESFVARKIVVLSWNVRSFRVAQRRTRERSAR